MAKITLLDDPLYSITNTNNDIVEAAIESTLSRDGILPNEMNANIDMNANRIINLPNAVGATEPVTFGQAGMIVGLEQPLTTEAVVAVLDDQDIGAILYPRTQAEITASVTPTDYAFQEGDVRRYGAVIDGATNDYQAIVNAIATRKISGGMVYFPPGVYKVNSQISISLTNIDRNIHLYGYGAEIKSGTGVTGHAIKVSSGYWPNRLKIEGFMFDHQNNTTVAGAIELSGAVGTIIADVTIVMHNTKAGYAGFKLGPSTLGNDDTGSFWTIFERCAMRMYGENGTNAEIGILLFGCCNATTIRGCSFSHVDTGIKITVDGVNNTLSNGVSINDSWFEGQYPGSGNGPMEACLWILGNPDPGYTPPGLRFVNNRIEAVDYVAKITTTGAGTAMLNHSTPPVFRDSYVVAGSVTNQYIYNPNNQFVSIFESSHYGQTGNNTEYIGSDVGVDDGDKRYRVEGNVILANLSGNSTYTSGHLVLGTYHIWVDGAGKLRIHTAKPTGDTNGVVVGAQVA